MLHYQNKVAKWTTLFYVAYQQFNLTEPIKKIINYIYENYNRKIYIEDLALEANMNVQYFCRFFKSVVGKTPVEYINSYRIEKATELLQTETLSISNIALNVGIDNFSYFIKQFKKYKNSTPSQYRKSLK